MHGWKINVLDENDLIFPWKEYLVISSDTNQKDSCNHLGFDS